MNTLFFTLVVLSCATAATQAETVTCYSCEYNLFYQDLNCLDPFDGVTNNVANETCDGMCKKSYGKVSDEITSMTRSCVSSCETTGCVGGFGIYGCDYCCSEDLCNAASSVTFSFAVLFSVTMFLLALRL